MKYTVVDNYRLHFDYFTGVEVILRMLQFQESSLGNYTETDRPKNNQDISFYTAELVAIVLPEIQTKYYIHCEQHADPVEM